MDIDLSQREQTIIRDRPWLVPGFGLVFVIVGLSNLLQNAIQRVSDPSAWFGVAAATLMGGGLFLFTARRCEYRFDRQARVLHWRQRSLLRTRHGRIPFDDIQRVTLRKGPDCDDDLYRVVLTTPDGEFPLSIGFTCNKDRQRAARDAIDAALRGRP